MTTGTTATARIRWEPTEPDSTDSFGFVGTLGRAAFTLWAPQRDDEAWEVTSTLIPHLPGERYVGTDENEAYAKLDEVKSVIQKYHERGEFLIYTRVRLRKYVTEVFLITEEAITE